MTRKILIPLYKHDVAPRFDLATEILITSMGSDGGRETEKIIVLPQASSEKLCHLILTEGIQTVICGGIEEEYYHYLIWKKVSVLDSIVGTWKAALENYHNGQLHPGTIVTPGNL